MEEPKALVIASHLSNLAFLYSFFFSTSSWPLPLNSNVDVLDQDRGGEGNKLIVCSSISSC